MHKHGGDIYQNRDLLDFSINVNPMGMPEGVREAARKGVDLAEKYPDTECRELRSALAEFHQIPAEFIICANGAAELIYSLVMAVRPRKALVPVPSFFEYQKALEMAGCEIIPYKMTKENKFTLGEEFTDYLTEDMDIVFLCNPNNPTGHIIEERLLCRVVRICMEKNIRLVMDECFLDFVTGKESMSLLSYVRETSRVFLLKAFTKLYAMPGLRLGYGICSDLELLSQIKERTQPWNVSIPAQMAGIAALREEEFRSMTGQFVDKERSYIQEELGKAGFTVWDSRANFVFFYSKTELYEFCLQQQILIRDCSNFEGLEQGYYRIAVRNHEDNQKILNVLREAAKACQK